MNCWIHMYFSSSNHVTIPTLNVSNNSLMSNCTLESNRSIIAGFLDHKHGYCPLDFKFAVQCSMKQNITRANFPLNFLKRGEAANSEQIKYLWVWMQEIIINVALFLGRDWICKQYLKHAKYLLYTVLNIYNVCITSICHTTRFSNLILIILIE